MLGGTYIYCELTRIIELFMCTTDSYLPYAYYLGIKGHKTKNGQLIYVFM